MQAAWLLLTFCAATRANFWLRTVPREFTQGYAEVHDRSVTSCLEQILHMHNIPQHIWESASMPLTMGGLGVGGASRTCDAAHWGSWADCLEMVTNRHPHIAHAILRGLASRTPGLFECRPRVRGPIERHRSGSSVLGSPCGRFCVLRMSTWSQSPVNQATVGRSLRQCRFRLSTEGRMAHPLTGRRKQWSDHKVARSLRSRSPRCPRAVSRESLRSRFGFSCCGASVLLCPSVFGPAGVAVSSTSLATTAHLAAQEGRWEEEGSLPKALWPRFAGKEEPGCLSMQCCGTSTLFHCAPTDVAWRFAEGLTLCGGCQLALDATVVSPLHGDATHRRRADIEDGVALREARKRKERTYPELCEGNGRARFVVIAGEVGGRWSEETKTFLWSLACAKASSVPATDVRQCPSRLVQEMDMPPGLLFGEGSGSLQGGFSRSGRPGAVSQGGGG